MLSEGRTVGFVRHTRSQVLLDLLLLVEPHLA
jgi:hypothetical protein